VEELEALSVNEPDGDVPALLLATTEMEYDEVLESPVSVQVVAPDVMHVAPPGAAVTV
jgi:hypothetical protein